MEGKPLRVAFLGAGNVGAPTIRALRDGQERFARLAGRPVEIARVVGRNPLALHERLGLPAEMLSSQIRSAVGQPDIDVIVALMGDAETEEGAIRGALEARQHVVTANKMVLARVGPELARLAREKERALLFEAAVGGGTPILRTLGTSLAVCEATHVQGILNGTCNFVLRRIEAGERFGAAVEEAQRLGFAEADPAADIDGRDAAAKLILTTAVASGAWFDHAALAVRGVRGISRTDMNAAAKLGHRVALVAEARLADDGTWEAGVEPCLVPETSLLAGSRDSLNGVAIGVLHGGPFFLAARGAGGDPTSVAILGDLLAIAQGRWPLEGTSALASAAVARHVPPANITPARFYVRPLTAGTARRFLVDARDVLEPIGGEGLTNCCVTRQKITRPTFDAFARERQALDGTLLIARLLEPLA